MKQLTFLISQPRSGSTMTQKILGSHSKIHTQSEPWILLHPFHADKKENIIASYNHEVAVQGLQDFCDALPQGREQYIREISRVYRSFYESILKKNDRNVFVDKTPRYYLIIDEILTFFPDAKIILLIRNPLAVLNSIVEVWAGYSLFQLVQHKQDLLDAPVILNAKSKITGNIISIKYEDILESPEKEIHRITDFLGMDFEPQMVNYGNEIEGENKWRYGDPSTVYKKKSPDSTSSERWIENLIDPQIWRLQKEYFDKLGGNLFDKLGYDSGKIAEILENYRPNDKLLEKTYSFNKLMDDQRDALVRLNWHYARLQQCDEVIKNKNKIVQEKDQLIMNIIQEKDQLIMNIIQEKDQLIMNMNATIQEKDQLIRNMNATIQEKDQRLIDEKEQEKEVIINFTRREQEIRDSYSYRVGNVVIKPFSLTKRLFKKKSK